jgi:hypothetical protein
MSLDPYLLDEFPEFLDEPITKVLICFEFCESDFVLFWTDRLIEYLITLILESNTADQMMTSLTRKYIPWIPTLWDIERKMYIVAFVEVIREWTILWESTVGDIENIRSTKEIVRIQTLFVICSIWYEITVLGCTIPIDIFTILTELIAVFETHLWSSRQEFIPILPCWFLHVER